MTYTRLESHFGIVGDVTMDMFAEPAFWISLFSVTLIQIALGADNLIIITILANKLPVEQRPRAVQIGLILAMLFRILLLAVVSYILRFATAILFTIDIAPMSGVTIFGQFSGKSIVLFIGGLFLIWKGIKELRLKSKGPQDMVAAGSQFTQVVTMIIGLNLLFSVDSILTVVGMTDNFAVMVGSVVISVALMLVFARPIAQFINRNPDFEILGLFVLLLIGFVLFLEGGHAAQLIVNGNNFPYIPQWIVIFILLLMFSVDLYQNWWERKVSQDPIILHRRKR
jgi:predicted tellurium resistance membrane protein TerC